VDVVGTRTAPGCALLTYSSASASVRLDFHTDTGEYGKPGAR
jgi:hypothetical protein